VPDQGVKHRFQPGLAGRINKGQSPHAVSVEGAFRGEHAGAELRLQSWNGQPARLRDGSSDGVGVHEVGAAGHQNLCNGALAAANAARETDGC
jgi:hypothetical protein